jgi:hypothetical protein
MFVDAECVKQFSVDLLKRSYRNNYHDCLYDSLSSI